MRGTSTRIRRLQSGAYPEAGHDGGRVVFEGSPEQLIAESNTHTAQHLRRHLAR